MASSQKSSGGSPVDRLEASYRWKKAWRDRTRRLTFTEKLRIMDRLRREALAFSVAGDREPRTKG